MRTFACIVWALIIPSFLWADDFSGFRVPKHSVYNLQGSTSGSFSRHSNSANDRNSRDWSLNGDLYGESYWLYDSDPLLLKAMLNSGVAGHVSAGRSDGISYEWQTLNRNSHRRTAEDWTLTSGLRVYPDLIPEFPLGLVCGTQINGSYDQQWDYLRQESANPTAYNLRIEDRHHSSYSYTVDGDAGLGVGRVRDATAVYDWYKMETRLRESGTLVRPLSQTARQKLIDLAYFGNDYSRIHDRYGKYYWREVERILIADSAVGPRGLNAYDVFRMADPYLDSNLPVRSDQSYPGVRERNFTGYGSPTTSYYVMRQRGWFVGFLVFASHDHQITRDFYRRRTYELDNGEIQEDEVVDLAGQENMWSDHIYYGPQGEVHLPWGPDWQFDGVSTFQIQWEKYYHSQNWTSSFFATYLIADRWLAFGSARYRWHVGNQWSAVHKEDVKSWDLNLAGQVDYYLEDRVSLYVKLNYSQGRTTDELSGDGSYTNRHNWGSTFEARLGLTYNILGRLEAPGVVPVSSIASGHN